MVEQLINQPGGPGVHPRHCYAGGHGGGGIKVRGTLSCPRLTRSGRPQVNTRLVFTGILGASRPDSSRGRRAPVASSAPSIEPCTGKTHASFTHAGVQVFTGASRAAVLTPWPPCPGSCRAALGGRPQRGTQTQTSRRVGRQRPSRPHCGYRGWLRGSRGLAGWWLPAGSRVTQLYHEHSN